MGIEIERKFLARRPADLTDCPSAAYRQAYLVSEPHLTVRVRMDNDSAWLTIKSAPQGFQRDEYEYAIPLGDAEEMLKTLCRGSVIEKTRYFLKQDALTWEIDVFEGENEGLIIAEVELDEADQDIEIPDWVIEEVSEDRRYSNAWLSQHPYTTWD